MLSRVEISNFQSLKKIDLELGSFTVIVGDSNCGKSALVRALQAVSSNIRGSYFITHGQKSASVSVSLEEIKITLEKSDSSGSYRIVNGTEREFSKLAGEVPADVTRILGLEPVKDGCSINFAGQHDPPFLLKESGNSTARVLGELTNVSTIFEAVRESNRRRAQKISELKTRQSDLDTLQSRRSFLVSIVSRKKALEEAEVLLGELESLQYALLYLSNSIYLLERPEVCEEVEIPDFSEIQNAQNDISRLEKLLEDVKVWESEQYSLEDLSTKANSELLDLEEALEQAMSEVNECPMCGNIVS